MLNISEHVMRRILLWGFFFCCAASPTFAVAGEASTASGQQMTYAPSSGEGDVNAPLNITEYFAADCGHCARLYTLTHTLFLEYIVAHRVHVTYVPIYFSQTGKQSALFIHCAPQEDVPQLVSEFLTAELNHPLRVNMIGAFMANLADQHHYNRDAINSCMQSPESIQYVDAKQQEAEHYLGVVNVPIYIIGNTSYRLDRFSTAEDLTKVLQYALSQVAPLN